MFNLLKDKFITIFRFSVFLFLLFLNFSCYFFVKLENLDKQSTINSGSTQSENLTSPSSAENIIIDPHSVNAFITWENNSKPNYYTIKYGTSSGIYPILLSTPILEKNFNLVNLNIETTYYLIITSHFDNDLKLDSSEITFNTLFSCLDFSNESNLMIKGEGSAASPYIICSGFQLKELGQISSANFLDKTFQLGNDIDMSEVTNFIPIGTSSNPFTGVFRGENHKINNWTWTSSSTDNIGIFGYVKGALINKINLENFNIDFGNGNNIGAFIGESGYGTKIEDINLQKIILSGTGNNVGGLIGKADAGLIRITAGSSVQIVTTGTNVGGIIGYFYNDFQEETQACYQNYLIESISEVKIYNALLSVGGLVGYSVGKDLICPLAYYKTMFSGSIKNLDILTSAAWIGGIVGYSINSIVSSSTFNGQVSGSQGISGIVGFVETQPGTTLIDKVISTGTIKSSDQFGGGIVGHSLNATLTISKSISSAYIFGGNNIGGILGGGAGTITHSIFNGILESSTSGNQFYGGILGHTGGNNVTYSYSVGEIRNSPQYQGGISGFTGGSVLFINKSYWDKQTTALTNPCGYDVFLDCNTVPNIAKGLMTSVLKNPASLYSTSGNDPKWSFYAINDASYTVPNDFWIQKNSNSYPDLFWHGYDEVNDSPFGVGNGSGTESDPYILDSPDDFNLISQNVELLTRNYRFKESINFSTISNTFQPWGDFLGTLDGKRDDNSIASLIFLSIGAPAQDRVGFISGSPSQFLMDNLAPVISIEGRTYFAGTLKNIDASIKLTGRDYVAPLSASPNYNYIFENIKSAADSANSVSGSGYAGLALNCFNVKDSSVYGFLTGNNNIGGLCNSTVLFSDVESSLKIIGKNNIGGLFTTLSHGLGYAAKQFDSRKYTSQRALIFDTQIISTGTNVGLGFATVAFRSLSDIENISMLTNTNTAKENFGGLIGTMRNVDLKNVVINQIEMVSQNNGKNIGGLVGLVSNVSGLNLTSIRNSIENIVSSGSINGANSINIGGLIGSIDRDVNLQIEKTYYKGQIVDGSSAIGGLVGLLSSAGTLSVGTVSILNSFSKATITGSGSKIGGLVGEIQSNNNLVLKNNYFAGLNQSTGSLKGAIIGLDSSVNSIFISNFWDNILNPTLTDNGTGNIGDSNKISSQSTTQLKLKTTFENVNWDFNQIWVISGTINNGYPSFQK